MGADGQGEGEMLAGEAVARLSPFLNTQGWEEPWEEGVRGGRRGQTHPASHALALLTGLGESRGWSTSWQLLTWATARDCPGAQDKDLVPLGRDVHLTK